MKPPAPIDRARRAIPLRTIIPNGITVLALCMGLSSVRFALAGQWETALGFIVIAGILDGFDGRIARLINGQTRFGAELDSLSDVIAFGVSPGLIVYLWSLQEMPRYGWIFALAFAAACALRLARFNARIDEDEQPHKSAGFLTGVPAPTAAGLVMLPIFLWLVTGDPLFQEFYVVAPWTALVTFLMVSDIATFSWASIQPPPSLRFGALVGIAAIIVVLVNIPWLGLSMLAIAYLASIPFSMMAYSRVKRRHAEAASDETPEPVDEPQS